MIRLVMQGSLVLMLAIGLIFQGVTLWDTWQAPANAPVAVAQAKSRSANQSGGEPRSYVAPKLETHQQTLARPLFVDGRRPPQPKPVVATQPIVKQPPPPPMVTLDRYRLLGVHVDSSVRRVLIETPSGVQTWVMQGGKIDEWTVTTVEDDRAQLSLRDRSGELRLYPKGIGG
jgi:hypothetical protein